MSQQRRQLVILVALIAVFGVLILRSLAGGPGTASRRAAPGSAETRTASRLGQPPLVPLRIDALEKKPGQYSPGRDPFRFEVKKAPPPPPRPPQPRPQRAQAPVRRPPPPPAGPQPPPVDFRFIGSFGPENGRIAVFVDGDDIYNVRRGGVLKEKFRVVEIGYESADIGFVDFPDAPAQRLAVGG